MYKIKVSSSYLSSKAQFICLDDTWKFRNKLGVEKSCKWIADKAVRIAKYCDTEAMQIYKKSCNNNCVDAVPTANPTSPRPTKSLMSKQTACEASNTNI